MSAIGSVIVIWASALPRLVSVDAQRTCDVVGLPAALRDARELTTVGHLTKAHAAEAELAVDRVWTAATLAAGVSTHFELRLLCCLEFERSLSHVHSP